MFSTRDGVIYVCCLGMESGVEGLKSEDLPCVTICKIQETAESPDTGSGLNITISSETEPLTCGRSVVEVDSLSAAKMRACGYDDLRRTATLVAQMLTDVQNLVCKDS